MLALAPEKLFVEHELRHVLTSVTPPSVAKLAPLRVLPHRAAYARPEASMTVFPSSAVQPAGGEVVMQEPALEVVEDASIDVDDELGPIAGPANLIAATLEVVAVLEKPVPLFR